MPAPQIKDEKTYRALRRDGNSEEKSARIANAAAASSRKKVGARAARARPTTTGPKKTWSSVLARSASRAGPR